MADVFEFAKRGALRPVVNAALVKQLETMLEQARGGQLTSAAYIGVYADGVCRHGWEKIAPHTDAIAAGLLCLSYRLGKSMVD